MDALFAEFQHELQKSNTKAQGLEAENQKISQVFCLCVVVGAHFPAAFESFPNAISDCSEARPHRPILEKKNKHKTNSKPSFPNGFKIVKTVPPCKNLTLKYTAHNI